MMLSPSWCLLYRDNEESIDHLLLHCRVSRSLWNKLSLVAGFSWAIPAKCSSLMVERAVGFGPKKMARME